LTFNEPIPQDKLSGIASRINMQCTGKNAEELLMWSEPQSEIEQEVLDIAAELLARASSRSRIIYSDGLVNILDPQRLADQHSIKDDISRNDLARMLVEVDSHGARQTLRLLEEHSLIEEILTEVLSPEMESVQVMIAGEGRWNELSHTSMVLSRYGVVGHATGAIGVLGPVRLRYGRAISAVRYVAGLMSELMVEIYGTGNEDV